MVAPCKKKVKESYGVKIKRIGIPDVVLLRVPLCIAADSINTEVYILAFKIFGILK